MARSLKEGTKALTDSDTVKGLSATAVAMGLVASPEEAEAAYIPLRAFKTGTNAAKKLYDDVTKLVDEGIDDAPGGELYQRTGAYRSEDGDIKIDVAELKARDQEAKDAVGRFLNDTEKVITTSSKKVIGKMGDYLPDNSPVFRYFPELKNTEVRIVPRTEKGDNSNLGYYTPIEETVTITVPKIKGAPPEEVNKRLGKIFNTLVHEFQHNIQDVKYAQNVGGGFDDKDFTAMINAYKANYKSAKPRLDKLQAENKFDPNNPEHAKLAGQVAQVERLAQDMNISADEFMDTTATQHKKSGFRKHKIYIRELGEMEARSSGRKKFLTEDDPQRKAVGVFYPKMSKDPGTMQAGEILSEPALQQEDALVRVYSSLDDAFEDYTFAGGSKVYKGRQRHETAPVPVDTSKIKKGVGIVAASTIPPSQALADELGLSTERVNTAEEMGLTEDDQSALNYLEMRTGARPTNVGSAPSDVLTDSPVVGDTLMAADLLHMASEISPATEEDTSAEPADEFSDVPRGMNQGGGLMKNEYNQLNPIPQQFPPPVQGTQVKPQYSLNEPLTMEMRQGGGVETEAGEEMAEDNPNKAIPEVADLDNDGTISSYEKTRHEAIQKSMKEDNKAEMAMGGMMQMDTDPFAPMQVVIGVDEVSGNEVPAGSKDEEVRDDIPAMLSEGEYVVPADVVRWHGLKTFEELRCEAKNAMGLMAMHDRISFVDGETKEPVDYASPASPSIEEKDKPEVEEAEVKVIEANEGTSVEPLANPTFYRYEVRLDPVTNRYRRVPIDPITGMEVPEQEFDPVRSTRYRPETVLGLAEKEETECPEGFYFDEEAGVCMPEEAPVATSVVQPDSGGGDSPSVDQAPVPYGEQLTTKIAEELGPLSEEDLEGYEGDTLAEQALSRATEDRGIGPVQAIGAALSGPAGIAGLAAKQAYNEVGAKRAMMTRTDELSNWGNITDETLAGNIVSISPLGVDPIATGDFKYTGPKTYNANFNPSTASFDVTSSSRITGVQQKSDGSGWVTDYQHTDKDGNDVDPFGSDAGFEAALDAIDRDFDSMTAVTGRSPGNTGVSVSVTTADGRDTSTSSTSSTSTSASPGSRGPSGGSSPGGSPGGSGPGSGSSSTGSPGTFVCTAAHDTGLTSNYIWSLDKKFGISVRKNDPYLYKGYEVFGPWLAEQIRKGKLKSFAELTPKIWAYEQAKNTHGNVKDYPAHVKALSKVYQYTTRPVIRLLGWLAEKVK